MLKWSLFISCLLWGAVALAQSEKTPTSDTLVVKQAPDSIAANKAASKENAAELAKSDTTTINEPDTSILDTTKLNRPRIRDFGVYIDYGKLIGLLVDYEMKYEGGARLIFGNNIFIGAEVGNATINPKMAYKNTSYEVSGSYMRIGLGKLGALNPKTNIGFGVCYAMANYSDGGTTKLTSPSGLHEDTLQEFSRTGMKANWYEFNFISESQLNKFVYAGLNLRVRVMGNYDAQSPLDVYTIPGYGRTFDKSLPAANLFLRFKLL